MTDRERCLRGFGISLLVHGALAGAALWLWTRPAPKPKAEPSRWEVNLFDSVRKPDPPAAPETPLQRPELASEPPEPALPRPSAQPLAATGGNAAGPAFDMPQLAAPVGGGAIGAIAVPAIGGQGWSMGGAATGAGAGPGDRRLPAPDFGGGALTPIARIPPVYPLEARRKKIEGWVRVEMAVREDGSVADVKVKGAEPAGVFEQAAVAAVSQWKFRPATENGQAVRRRAGQTLKFELNK